MGPSVGLMDILSLLETVGGRKWQERQRERNPSKVKGVTIFKASLFNPLAIGYQNLPCTQGQAQPINQTVALDIFSEDTHQKLGRKGFKVMEEIKHC